ncbi:acylneuraminate cytidylyltransferase [Flavobacterium zhairuonense]|uniref:acylneuraminate cytidylyltransferase n=1 Tax=Flavobacterium zhairuonense TaxID=2493631 RepID=UPI00104C2B61|nr:acylneuraminate cytidylyltransferase [Flavobacterium zhairuonense]KAF2510813.1 acylneuraminate cytidylyltransferase [Flavobacterium zhairuonense]
MKKIAIIPLRKGSKGIPGKNKKKLVGRPLFSWVLSEAIFSNLDEVFVFTDDVEIINYVNREYAWSSKVKTVLRSEKNANDTASTESGMIEFVENLTTDFEILCLLQATSPFTRSTDINAVLKEVIAGRDSALTVVNTHRFTWNANGTPQNYNVFERPRRQDFEGLLIENGAIYATTKKAFLETKNRVSGSIGLVEMSEDSLTEIDSMTDWFIVENLLVQRLKREKQQKRINYLVLDVDGVFTDGRVAYDKNGEDFKVFDMRDGMGLEILRQNNVKVIVLTSENSELVAQRMRKLQIEDTFLGVKDKYSFLQHYLQMGEIPRGALAYVGDDVNDMANMCSVGWSFAPANAVDAIKQNADLVLTNISGAGAIREVCEWIMKYNVRY